MFPQSLIPTSDFLSMGVISSVRGCFRGKKRCVKGLEVTAIMQRAKHRQETMSFYWGVGERKQT